MSTSREKLRAAALGKRIKRKNPKDRVFTRDPRTEPAIERIVRLNQTHRRSGLGLSQRQLAAMLDVSQAHIAALELANKPQTPSLEFLERLANALGCSAAELVTPGRFAKPRH